jgi:hypothetical protein
MVIVGFIVINQFVVWFLRVDYLYSLINNSIYIRTWGSGRGYWGGINNFLKDNVWSPIDQKVINKFR